jgi:hypothetical protein
MSQKNVTFCISWKEKIFDDSFFCNQQITNHNKIDLYIPKIITNASLIKG